MTKTTINIEENVSVPIETVTDLAKDHIYILQIDVDGMSNESILGLFTSISDKLTAQGLKNFLLVPVGGEYGKINFTEIKNKQFLLALRDKLDALLHKLDN